MWWSEPLDPATFLVHQDRRIAAQGLASTFGQAVQLLGCCHVAGKEDDPPRVCTAEE